MSVMHPVSVRSGSDVPALRGVVFIHSCPRSLLPPRRMGTGQSARNELSAQLVRAARLAGDSSRGLRIHGCSRNGWPDRVRTAGFSGASL